MCVSCGKPAVSGNPLYPTAKRQARPPAQRGKFIHYKCSEPKELSK